MIQFRNYQTEIIEKSVDILSKHRFLYLSMEVRTGKTLYISWMPKQDDECEQCVLFITKKKAISSIESDYDMLNPSYNIFVINYESLHKIKQRGWDAIVCDEAHSMGAFQNPTRDPNRSSHL